MTGCKCPELRHVIQKHKMHIDKAYVSAQMKDTNIYCFTKEMFITKNKINGKSNIHKIK